MAHHRRGLVLQTNNRLGGALPLLDPMTTICLQKSSSGKISSAANVSAPISIASSRLDSEQNPPPLSRSTRWCFSRLYADFRPNSTESPLGDAELPDVTQKLPRKLRPTRPKEPQKWLT
jgi:hypothetical protein